MKSKRSTVPTADAGAFASFCETLGMEVSLVGPAIYEENRYTISFPADQEQDVMAAWPLWKEQS